MFIMPRKRIAHTTNMNEIIRLDKLLNQLYLVEIPVVVENFSLGFDNLFKSPIIIQG